jgi:aspartyl-tRNA synthetase
VGSAFVGEEPTSAFSFLLEHLENGLPSHLGALGEDPFDDFFKA